MRGGGILYDLCSSPIAFYPRLKLLNIILYGLYRFIMKFELNLIENICKYMQSLWSQNKLGIVVTNHVRT